ncbi:hypothetical protein YC2023_089211 [Brassica napus]
MGVRQHTQDVRGCPSAHTGRSWLSVCVCLHTQDVRGCPSVHISARCLFSTHRTSVGVRQYTEDVRGCPSAHTGRPWLSLCVCVCTSAHTGGLWLSISTHISTLVLGLSTLTLPMDCSGDFGPRGLSVQYTQDVCGCPPAHTRNPWLSVCVRMCPYLSVSTHRMSVAVHQYTYHHAGPWTQHAGPSRGLFGTHKTIVVVRVGLCVSVSTHRRSVAVHQYTYQHVGPWTQHADPSRGLFGMSVAVHQYTYHHAGPWTQHVGPSRGLFGTHISTLVLGLSMLTIPVDCSGDFGPRGQPVQYTQDVRGCPPAHSRRPWLSVCVRVGVRQHTQDVRGCPSAHTGHPWLSVCVRVCPSAHTERPWLSISTHVSTLDLGLRRLNLPVDCSGDFGPCGMSVQYTQDVRGCPPSHTGRPWMSVSTHRTFVAVQVCLSVHTGRPWLSISTHISTTHRTSLGVRHHTQDVRGSSYVSISTHRTSVAVHQYTYQHAGPWSQHTGPSRGLFGCFWPTWAVCSVHTGRPRVSVSTHRTSVCVRQHTQDVCVCPSAYTGRPWLSGCIRVCLSAHIGRLWLSIIHTGRPWVFASTHMTSVAVLVCPSAHTGRSWLSISTHISTLVLGPSTLALPVDCSGDFGQRGLSVKYTQDVRGCPAAHTGSLWLSVCVCVCPTAHIGRLWLSISSHISMLALPVDCSADFGPRGLSVQYTQDLRVCPSSHTGRSCVSVSTHRTSVAVRQHTQNVRGCPSVHISARCPTLGEFCFTMIGRADIEGSKSNVAMNAWLPKMCRPSQTPHLTMSSAWFHPPKGVLGLKEGVVTTPPIHGADVPSARGLGRNLRSKTRRFTGFCNSHQVSRFATFFIDARGEISVAESRFRLYIAALLSNKHRLRFGESRLFSCIFLDNFRKVRNRPTESDVSSFSGHSVSRTANHPRRRDPIIQSVGATGGVYKGQGRSQRGLMTRAY